MQKEIDLLLYDTLSQFKPFEEQVSLKMLLHERVSAHTLGRLTRSTLVTLEPYLAPFTLSQIEEWNKQYGFFEWLLLPDSYIITIHRAKEEAANALVDILRTDPYDQDINHKTSMLRLKAAEILLKTEGRKEQRVSNTLKISGSQSKLMNKSAEALQEDLKRLKESK